MKIEFEEGQQSVAPPDLSGQPEKGIAGLLIRSGIVRNRMQANLAMIGAIIVLALVIFFTWPRASAPEPVLTPGIDPATGLPY